MELKYIIFIILGVIVLIGLSINPPEREYGELYNYTSGGYLFNISDSSVYYNLTGLVGGHSRGVAVLTNALQPRKTGAYYSTVVITFSSAGTGDYGVGIAQNYIIQRDCYGRVKFSNAGDVGQLAISCIHDFNAYDIISIQIDDETNPAKDITITAINFHIVLI